MLDLTGIHQDDDQNVDNEAEDDVGFIVVNYQWHYLRSTRRYHTDMYKPKCAEMRFPWWAVIELTASRNDVHDRDDSNVDDDELMMLSLDTKIRIEASKVILTRGTLHVGRSRV